MLLTSFLSLRVMASTDASFAKLRLHKSENEVSQYRAFPAKQVNMLFPSSDAWLEGEQNPNSLNLSASPISGKIHLLRVGDSKHRFVVTAATIGDELFVFDPLFCQENSGAMGRLIQAANSAPQNDAEALDLAKLYLALSYYQLDAPESFVALRGDNTPTGGGSETVAPFPFSDSIGVSHSPQISHLKGAYVVDLYTHNKLRGYPISHWTLQFSDSGFEEQMFVQRKAHNDSGANKEEKNIAFINEMMANGSTDDGATTDMQFWSASKGPGMSRVHYYYNSREGAEKRMHDFLQNAVAVLEEDQGDKAGTNEPTRQALIIQTNNESKSLLASQLYEDEKSVLEYSCTCLHSLLLARNPSATW
jgi:hypothetical protein